MNVVIRGFAAAAFALVPSASAQTPARPPGQDVSAAIAAYTAWAQTAAPTASSPAPRYVAAPGMTAAGHPTTVILDSATGRAWILTSTDPHAPPALVPLAYVAPPVVVPPGLSLTPRGE